MIANLLANLLEEHHVLRKGENMFLGKTVDIGTRDVVLLTEEAAIPQPVTFREPSQDNDAYVTFRTVWGNTYLSSQQQAMNIYNFLRTWPTQYPFINFELQLPAFAEKVKNGQRFKFDMLVKVKYFASRIQTLNRALNFAL